MFAKVDFTNNTVLEYPVDLQGLKMANQSVSFPSYLTTSFLASLGYVQVKATPKPESTLATRVSEANPVLIGGEWTQRWELVDVYAGLPNEQKIQIVKNLKRKKKHDLAIVRYTKETSGIIVNGATISTDAASQSKIAGAHSFMQLMPDATLDFKTTTGWIKLTKPEVDQLALAIGTHVQACFSNERFHSEAIDALPDDINTVSSYNINTGWPT